MSLLKRTYSLPAETIQQFEEIIPAGERSQVLARMIQDWLEARRKEALRQDMIECCKEMADVWLELERDFHPLEEEVHRALDRPQTRRRGASPARSRRRA